MLKKLRIPNEWLPIYEDAPPLPEPLAAYNLLDLLQETKFCMSKANPMGGITFHKNFVVINSNYFNYNKRYQISLIAHELVHVAQQKKWGWWKFMYKYFKEFTKGTKKAKGNVLKAYDEMRTFGIEKEAYDYQRVFEYYLRYTHNIR